jgi:hypothetical protein
VKRRSLPDVETNGEAFALRILVAARKMFGVGGWMNVASVRLHMGGSTVRVDDVKLFLGRLERAGKIEHRELRGESQWRAPEPGGGAS